MNFSDLVAPAFIAADDNNHRRPLLLLPVVLVTCRRISCPSTRVVVLAMAGVRYFCFCLGRMCGWMGRSMGRREEEALIISIVPRLLVPCLWGDGGGRRDVVRRGETCDAGLEVCVWFASHLSTGRTKQAIARTTTALHQIYRKSCLSSGLPTPQTKHA